MKKIILMTVLFNMALCFAGDGTLPVIRSLEINFINNGPGTDMGIPECLRLNINKEIKKDNSITKVFKLKLANLGQEIKLSNLNGDLDVIVKSVKLNTKKSLPSLKKDLNEFEFMNEFKLNETTLIQHIRVNPDQLSKNCEIK